MFRNINELGDWIEPGFELAALLDAAAPSPSKLPSSVSEYPLGLVPWSLLTHQTISKAVSFANSVFDDIYTVAKIRAFKLTRKPWLFHYADRQCNRLWFTSVLLGLYGERNRLISQQKRYEECNCNYGDGEEMRKLAKLRKLSVVNVVKLLCDLVFTGKCKTGFQMLRTNFFFFWRF